VNEVSLLCEAVGADIQDVTRGMGLDGRIGPRFLQAGPGYGGSCFPKDTRALLDVSAAEKVPMRIVTSVVEANEAQITRCVDKIRDAFDGLRGKTVALLGLAFKSDTDDLRESPAMKIAAALLAEGSTVRAFDPAAMENAEKELPGLVFCKDPYDSAEGADGIVIATEWKEFKGLDWERLKEKLRVARVVDLRNLHDPDSVREKGFAYTSVGRP
jgi:UDPglucose 6-dehydrogenase